MICADDGVLFMEIPDKVFPSQRIFISGNSRRSPIPSAIPDAKQQDLENPRAASTSVTGKRRVQTSWKSRNTTRFRSNSSLGIVPKPDSLTTISNSTAGYLHRYRNFQRSR